MALNNMNGYNTMEKELSDYSREQLIKVIANMHDAIQEWYGYGRDSQEGDDLEHIGNLCIDFCMKNDWNLPSKDFTN